jgi:hypothetical protein
MIVIFTATLISALSFSGAASSETFWSNEISMLVESINGGECSAEVNANIPERAVHGFICEEYDHKECLRRTRNQPVKNKEIVDNQICRGGTGCRPRRSPLCNSIGAIAARKGDNSKTTMKVTWSVIGEIVAGVGLQGLESEDLERLFWSLYDPLENYEDPLLEGARNVLAAELLWATLKEPPENEDALRKVYEVVFYNLYLNPHSGIARKMYVFASSLVRPPQSFVRELVKLLGLEDETAVATSELLLRLNPTLERMATEGSENDLVCISCWRIKANEQLWAELKKMHDRWSSLREFGEFGEELRKTQMGDAQIVRESLSAIWP